MDLQPLPGLRLDPARLKQVLLNYLSNAVKFTPEGGRIQVRALPLGPDRWRLEVEDSGVGISEADQARLFAQFQQLRQGRSPPQAGTGLGLALTRRLVELQGGTVGVQSTPGHGSTFHAELPRVFPAAP
jgi:signal transduction histidine kinase